MTLTLIDLPSGASPAADWTSADGSGERAAAAGANAAIETSATSAIRTLKRYLPRREPLPARTPGLRAPDFVFQNRESVRLGSRHERRGAARGGRAANVVPRALLRPRLR